MIKLVFPLRRTEGLDREAFQRYWLQTHAPLVASHAETLRIRRYVQTHTLDAPVQDALRASRGGPDAYDGVAELWWDSLDDLAAGAATDDGREAGRALLADERRFIDLSASPLWVAHEHVVVDRR